LPARYVSGYLETDPPPGQPKLRGVDASHAWVSFFCPSIGWLDLDATNNCLPSLRHITVGWGRDYSDVCPLRGVLVGGQNQTLRVSVDVNALGPRESDTGNSVSSV
jgi:transglutaminase-like putative cysteine protease